MTITGMNEKDCVGEAKSRISVLWCVSLEHILTTTDYCMNM